MFRSVTVMTLTALLVAAAASAAPRPKEMPRKPELVGDVHIEFSALLGVEGGPVVALFDDVTRARIDLIVEDDAVEKKLLEYASTNSRIVVTGRPAGKNGPFKFFRVEDVKKAP